MTEIKEEIDNLVGLSPDFEILQSEENKSEICDFIDLTADCLDSDISTLEKFIEGEIEDLPEFDAQTLSKESTTEKYEIPSICENVLEKEDDAKNVFSTKAFNVTKNLNKFSQRDIFRKTKKRVGRPRKSSPVRDKELFDTIVAFIKDEESAESLQRKFIANRASDYRKIKNERDSKQERKVKKLLEKNSRLTEKFNKNELRIAELTKLLGKKG